MNFLLVNDDGFYSKGMEKLVMALKEIGDVFVCAPSEQRSSSGHGISIGKPLSIKEVQIPGTKKGWSCSGLPVDCTRIGIHLMDEIGERPDMIFSGINHGGNLGKDTLYSGTVAAAAEGAMGGIQSVAVSVDSHEPKHFEMAAELAAFTAKECYKKISPSIVININTPDLPKEEIKGIKVASLGERKYTDTYIIEDGKHYLVGDLLPYQGDDLECDVALCESGYAVITPINIDMTDREKLIELKEMFK